jgi:hypothetical protein
VILLSGRTLADRLIRIGRIIGTNLEHQLRHQFFRAVYKDAAIEGSQVVEFVDRHPVADKLLNHVPMWPRKIVLRLRLAEASSAVPYFSIMALAALLAVSRPSFYDLVCAFAVRRYRLRHLGLH